jgi:NAD(P)-dependent dehydrogenase (short-subunit alcohol dehydrogenase family)
MLHKDKVAIVTGAAQGIGRACAERLARDGASVVAADVNDKALGEAVDAIKAAGGSATAVGADIAQSLDVHNLLAATLGAYGRVDILVNNAGIVDDRPFLELELAEFDRILGVNLRGAFMVAQAAARQMVKQAKAAKLQPGASAGAIVNMSSINAWFGLPDHVAYSVSKGGITQLTRSMAVALAPLGIRVNAVGPGSIATPMLQEVVKDEAFRKKALSRTPLGRFGRVDEIAAVVTWLASEEASYLTGTTVYADGGRMPLNYTVPVPD